MTEPPAASLETSPHRQHCGALGSNSGVALKRCKGCYITEYCSKDCQTAAWPQHEAMCKILAGRKDIMVSARKRITRMHLSSSADSLPSDDPDGSDADGNEDDAGGGELLGT